MLRLLISSLIELGEGRKRTKDAQNGYIGTFSMAINTSFIRISDLFIKNQSEPSYRSVGSLSEFSVINKPTIENVQ